MTAQTAKRSTRPNFFRMLVRMQNPFMKWLLQSPFHGIVSRSYMLITVTGRVSGKAYTTPVQYGRLGEMLAIITSEDYRWWRNLVGGAEVAILLQGKTLKGRAHIETERTAVKGLAQVVYPTLKDEQFVRFFQNSLAVVITPSSGL